MYRDLINFLLSTFHSFHDFSRCVMQVFSLSIDLGDLGTISVGGVMFGSLFLVFASVQLIKWLARG